MKKKYIRPNFICDKIWLEDSLMTTSLVIGGADSAIEIQEEISQEDTQDWMFKID